MTAPIDAPWNLTRATDDALNKTTYGQGTIFPGVWPTNRLFWRSDRKRLYTNIGTLSVPVWEGANTLIGTIQMYVGSTIPTGWLFCDGALVSKATYPELSSKCGDKFKDNDDNDSTKFRLPNMNEKFPRGAADVPEIVGKTGGDATVTLTGRQSGTSIHSHDITDPKHSHGYMKSNLATTNHNVGFGKRALVSESTDSSITGITIDDSVAANAQDAHKNVPPYVNMYFIIAV